MFLIQILKCLGTEKTQIVNTIRLIYKGNMTSEISHFPISTHALILTANMNVHVGRHTI